jgi:hypothetical protein
MSGTDDTRQEQDHTGAEAQLAQANARADELQKRLDEAERRREIDAALLQAETIDLETARLLAERAMSEPATGAKGAGAIVADLRRRKPFLFRASGERGAAMAPEEIGAQELRTLVAQARASGDRRALMKYLRARRGE